MNGYVYQKMTFSEINKVLENCYICVLGMCCNDMPYQVPMYFTYDRFHGEPKFILESKQTSQKIDILKSKPDVSLFIQFNEPDEYKSVLVSGRAKLTNMDNSCSHSNMVSIVIEATELTGRVYRKK